MAGWLTRQEALDYFGLGHDEAELERIVVEHKVDAEVDADGRIELVDADEAKAALFAEHARAVGHRPDDRNARAKAERNEKRRKASAKRRRQERRARLEARVAKRKDHRIIP